VNYYAPLGLAREPFSNSPDPNFLYDSVQHASCLQQLEISVRLRRGLCVVTGEIGTGKTTLCRRFVRHLSQSPEIAVHLLLDPLFPSGEAFLRVLFGFFTGREPAPGVDVWRLKEGIKKALFRLGVREGRLPVLIIDEGQKLTPECLELLRELLNYETNAQKLLQIVVFAQREIEPVLEEMRNLLDRVNCYHRLRPLDFAETRAMIRFRLTEAAADKSAPPDLFSGLACWAVHRASGGYPRRIVRLCHKVVLELLIRRKGRAGWRLVRACVGQERRQVRRAFSHAVIALSVLFMACAGVWALYRFDLGGVRQNRTIAGLTEAAARILPAEPAREVRRPVSEPVTETPAAPVVAPAPAEQEAPAASAPSREEPAVLGTLRLEQGELPREVVRDVYGAASDELLALVLAANPGLKSPDESRPGLEIRLPEPPENRDPAFKRLIWVQLARAGSLDKAYAELRRLGRLSTPLRLLVWRGRGQGAEFSVVAETPFLSESPALALIGSLPVGLKDEARMLQFARKDGRFLGRLDATTLRLVKNGG
jgi:type II secretory pathway predicted ATPase ExeA/phage tail protein X